MIANMCISKVQHADMICFGGRMSREWWVEIQWHRTVCIC